MMRVAVLYGGISAEREVSLSSGRQVIAALAQAGYEVTPVLVGPDLGVVIAALEPRPDAVFNALHGTPGEDGTVQGMLDLMDVPYTHSGMATSVIAIDKVLTKQALVPQGIRMPGGRIVESHTLFYEDPLPRPYVLKPVNEGSSVGVAIVTDESNYGSPIARDSLGPWQEFDRLLAEPFIRGRELTVAVLDGEALAVTELQPKSGFYDYDSKYTDGMTDHVCPADIPADVADAAMRMAEDAHLVLGCRGVSRSDFRWDDADHEDGGGAERLYLLEINTQPGMTPLSLVPEQARSRGIAYPELVRRIVEAAMAGQDVVKTGK